MTAVWQEQVSLKPFNTFGIDVKARYFTQAHSDEDVREALAQARQRELAVHVIGGSNLLLTRDIDAVVLHMASRGRRVMSDDGDRVVVEAQAGEPWHPFVQWSLAQGYCGLENLSLIPGTVGLRRCRMSAPTGSRSGCVRRPDCAGPGNRRAARFQPGGLCFRLPRQRVQAQPGALVDSASTLCPQS